MDGFTKRKSVFPATDLRSIGRMLFVVAFAVGGALAVLPFAPIVLNVLFNWISYLVSRGPKTGVEAPHFNIDTPSAFGFGLLGALAGSYLGGRILAGFEKLVQVWDGMESSDKVTLFVGVFAGLIASSTVLNLLSALALTSESRIVIMAATMIGLSALAIYVLQSISEYLPWNRGKGTRKRSGIKILDTNVIIDGRIYDVTKTGFLDGQLYVPGFVLEELQYIADSHDALRRQRGRRGLDVLKHMQAEFPLDIRVHDKLAPDQGDGVDARLVRLAKSLGADIVTNDFNLNRVAALQDVKVMNLNDLALSLRPNVLPTETLDLFVSREGNQIGQGVGYLDDGTMVVVENGKPHIGESVEVVVTQVIQTERGKMIFAEVPGDPDPTGPRRRATPRRPQI